MRVTLRAWRCEGRAPGKLIAHFPLRHLSEQYFTFSQSRAHFLRHSNSRLHRRHTLGANPFLIFAFIGLVFHTGMDSTLEANFELLLRVLLYPPLQLTSSEFLIDFWRKSPKQLQRQFQACISVWLTKLSHPKELQTTPKS